MPKHKQTTKCLRIGITGGIGSGKTTVCRIFEALGVPLYDADYWAKWLIVHDERVKAAIIALFGAEAYLEDGSYNRAFVASVVFKNKEKMAALNAAVHPAVEAHSMEWHLKQTEAGHPYALKEAALLVESKSHLFLDGLIVVTAPEALRIQRVKQRDGLSEAAIRARMRNQLPEADKVALADFVITNDEQQLLLPQVWTLHQQLIVRSRSEF